MEQSLATFNVSKDQQQATYMYPDKTSIILHATEAEFTDCLKCHLYLVCSNKQIDKTFCMSKYRQDGKTIIWRTDAPLKNKKLDKKPEIEIAPDDQSLIIYNPCKNTKVNLIAKPANTCRGCYFNNKEVFGECSLNSEFESKMPCHCSQIYRDDQQSIIWVENKDYMKIIEVSADQRSLFFIDENGNKAKAIAKSYRNSCKKCVFHCNKTNGCCKYGVNAYCSSMLRSDYKSIIWVKDESYDPNDKQDYNLFKHKVIKADDNKSIKRFIIMQRY